MNFGTSSAPPTTTVIAHRGASAAAPENTLAAAELAIANGAAMIECDVRRTADGELVVLHDATLGRTTNAAEKLPRRAPWNVADLTLDQIRSLDAGSWFDIAHVGQHVPTLGEWLAVIGGRAGCLIELKHPGRTPGIEHDLAAALRANQWARRASHAGQLVVQSFDHDWLRDVYRPIADGVSLGALCASRPSVRQVSALSQWAEHLNPRLGATDRALISNVHDNEMSINVWTVDETTDMRRLTDAGVDGLITNRPGKLRQLLRQPGSALAV